MGKLIDLTGRQFERLKVIERDLNRPKGRAYWICECKCGKIVSIRSDRLLSGITKSCGCYNNENRIKIGQNNFKDITNKRFGLLTAKFPTDRRASDNSIIWFCTCECGATIEVRGSDLRSGNTNSCGCLKSKGELNIGEILRNNHIIFIKQYSFEDLKGKNKPLKFDFAIFKNNQLQYLIEFDGNQHEKAVEYFGGEEHFVKQQEYDRKKNEYCKQKNIPLIRIPYSKLDSLTIEDLLLNSSKFII